MKTKVMNDESDLVLTCNAIICLITCDQFYIKYAKENHSMQTHGWRFSVFRLTLKRDFYV